VGGVPEAFKKELTVSIEEFSHVEHQMVVSAEERYGDYFTIAQDVTLLLSNIMSWSYRQEWCMGSLIAFDFRRRVSAEPVDRLAPVRRP
jgi:hypothetical protein